MSTILDTRKAEGTALSFEERSVWVQLASILLMYGYYFISAWRMADHGVTELGNYVVIFCVAIGWMIGVQIVGHAAAAAMGRPERRDVRDREVAWRARAHSTWVLIVGVLCALASLILGVEGVWVAQILIATLFAGELLKLGLQLVYYRRGF